MWKSNGPFGWLVLGALSVPALPAQGWIILNSGQWHAPSQRADHVFVYDENRRLTVLFGGADHYAGGGYILNGETWDWDGTTWNRRFPTHAPSPRLGCAYGYDPVRLRVVVHGGWDLNNTLVDTWEYDGSDWTLVPSAHTPPGFGFQGIMGFDATRRLMSVHQSTFDTWAWDGVDWTLVPTAHRPAPPQISVSLATDSRNHRVLLYGGFPWCELWQWDGSDWSFVANMPAAASECRLAFDNSGNGVLVDDDYYRQGSARPSFVFAGNSWPVDPAATTNRSRFGLAFDKARDIFLMHGGEVLDISGYWIYSQTDTLAYVPPVAATLLPFGTGCAGSAGMPQLSVQGAARPILGSTLTLELGNLPPATLAMFLLGASDTHWIGGSLPAPLAAFGMPGCSLYVSLDQSLFAAANQGHAQVAVHVPASTAFVGRRAWFQGAALDPAANATGIVVANALTARIGAL